MDQENFTILYTDDDIDDREFFMDAGREVSPSLTIATQSNAKELIELLRNPPPMPIILFLDLNMPIKNGYEVLKELKECQQTRHIPVIIFSTSNDATAIDTTRQLGANLYIPKPTTYSHLKEVIRHSISIDWDTFSPSSEEFVYRVN